MKKIQLLLVLAFSLFASTCFISCEKDYAYYIVEGRLIDKTTKEPLKDILVAFNKYDIIHPKGESTQRKMPVGGPEYSDTNGEFRTFEQYSTSLLYIYAYSSYENSLYKDTTISVDFSQVPLSGNPHKKYKGDYVLNIGDIELEKID